MNICVRSLITAALLAGAAGLLSGEAHAGSCCGGGSAAALVLPRNASAMLELSLDEERYNGFWNRPGDYVRDQPGTDLRQYRMTAGYALRLGERWQTSVALPLVWNVNAYPSGASRSDGTGDTQFTLWYEAASSALCRLGWSDLSPADLVPSATAGLSLTIPTGISPYDAASNSTDITGRGFYRLDGNLLFDKTIYPLSISLFLSYGTHLERPVDREYGAYIQPYRKKLGDRATGTFSITYDHKLDVGESRSHLAFTAAFAEVWEDQGTINGDRDRTSGFRKSSLSGTVAWSSLPRDWIVKATWNHAIARDGWGSNFPASDIFSLAVTHVFE